MIFIRNIFTTSAVFLLILLMQSCREDDPVDDVTNVTDYDGNSYNVIRIGKQLWMAENLKTTHLNDGTAIPSVTENSKWVNTYSAGLSIYNNDEASYKEVYGILYNYYAVKTGKLCPTGWHVPSDKEWAQLIDYVGNNAGKLKETGTNHWQTPNTSDNASGFTALPGGYRTMYNGTFSDIGIKGYWSTSTLGAGHLSMGVRFYGPLVYILSSSSNDIVKMDLSVALPFSGMNQGLSIRCVKD
ncbi:MAG: fibrobacter succinogenes major paralogous domain-containing protein [Bacteroidia bacterium]|nr:fibrobacter succinogenes major paralogous domain-containing protein [Bacteroidia bacterium]